jgi:hypothetical protein
MKNRKYHTIRTVPKSNRKLVEREAKSKILKHIGVMHNSKLLVNLFVEL